MFPNKECVLRKYTDLYMDCRHQQVHLSHKGGQWLHMDFQKDFKTVVVVDPSSSSAVAGGGG